MHPSAARGKTTEAVAKRPPLGRRCVGECGRASGPIRREPWHTGMRGCRSESAQAPFAYLEWEVCTLASDRGQPDQPSTPRFSAVARPEASSAVLGVIGYEALSSAERIRLSPATASPMVVL